MPGSPGGPRSLVSFMCPIVIRPSPSIFISLNYLYDSVTDKKDTEIFQDPVVYFLLSPSAKDDEGLPENDFS